ncbi:DUF7507 domain-containing protein [Lentzea albida]|uniref:Conserved repeat domain-containing protein n=1 Tax=Lentzea albida TaxID=65499 RepID=A0A1H9CNS3_9PSEU|nr:GEVED domain-containing protein [Lentzea albida]SEQ02268.1 conserved repeat domain-containing protein [Lentzea albida]
MRAALLALLLVVSATTFSLPAQAYQSHAAGSWSTSSALPATNASARSTLSSGTQVTASVSGANVRLTTLNSPPGDRGAVPGNFRPQIPANTALIGLTAAAAGCAAFVDCFNRGTLTFSFNRPVRDPVLHIAGSGATVGNTGSTHVAHTLTTPGVTLDGPLAGATNMTIGQNGTRIEAPNRNLNVLCNSNGARLAPASCGSVKLNGTISSVSFQIDMLTNSSTPTDDFYVAGVSVDEDFGDAPASYDAGSAASHTIGDLVMGSGVSADNPATINTGSVTPSPKAVAAGADNNTPNGDDLDDGVAAFPRLARSDAGEDYSVRVALSGASQPGRTCAWIDFNGNDTFDSGNERACTDFPAGATSVTITWKIPGSIRCGTTYARFRASYNVDQVRNEKGLADSGEVEDYRLPVECLDIKKSTTKTTANPGEQVPYTVTITNSGATDVTGLSVSDDLTQVLDDATFNNDQAATSGSISYTAPKLTWSGDIGKGRTVTLTYSVTVKNPITGDHQLRNAVVSSAGNCLAGSTDPDCSTTVNTPGVKIEKSVDRQAANPGDTVTYTVKVTNTGKTPLNAMFADDLTKVLDDATWGSATASSGTANFVSPTLTWTGALAVGASATVTYTVVVTGKGDKQLTNVVTSETPGNNCVPSCTTDTPVSGITFEKKADKQSANPGETVTYTVTVTNTGRTPWQGATFTDDLARVLDDAEWVSAAASSGTAEFTAPKLTWTGNLPVGGSATVTYAVKVTNPVQGDFQLANAITSTTPGGNCPPGSTDPKCGTTTPVAGLKIEKSVDRQSANPGDTVTYTVKVTNTGKTALNATFSDDLSKVLDDADWIGTSAGTFTSPVLTWNGSLAVGGSATVTYSVKVTGKGDHLLDNVITSTTPGSNCPEGSADADCRTSTPVSGVEIKKGVDRQSANPGDTVKYTVTVRNTGKTASTPSFIDDLTQVLDDATWGSVTASSGTADFAAPKLTWTGPLAPGEAATITYTVVVNGKGDKQLTNVVTSETPGNNCVPNCTTTTPVSGVEFEKAVDRQSAKPGDTVKYTVTVRNTGKTPLQGATFTDDLAKVLDDAEWVSAEASTGSATFTAPRLTWTGDLAAGGTATVTYTVKVGDPADFRLDNVITSTTPGANCPGGDKCSTSTPIAGLRIEKSDDRDQVVPGDTVTYTIKVTNTGQTVQTGASFTDDLTQVLDDARYNDDAQATIGAVALVWPRLEWKGDLPIGATATITYTVTVKNPNPGDKRLNNKITSDTPGTNCPPGSKDPSCSTETPGRELTIEKKVDRQPANPGDPVTYTVTITNTGQVPLTGAKVTDDLSGVLDDATWVSGQATPGAVALVAPTLTWTGDLAVGATATVTYVVRVDDPIKGDHALVNRVSTEIPGNCPPGSTDPRCGTTTPLPGMEIVKEVDRKSANPGDTVTYTVTVRNTGQTELNASFRDDLTQVLDDATWGGTDAGTFTSPVLTWNGTLPVGGTATIRYSVVVTGKGDHQLTNVVTSDTPGNNCVPNCTTTTPVSGVQITKTAEPSSAKPGDTVTYTVTVRNTGRTVLDASFRDDLTGVLDDATWIGASAGTFASPVLTWSGQLAVDGTATVTYTVKVTGAGDKRLKNVVTSETPGNNCADGCTTDTPVASLKLVKRSEPATAKPGDIVKYTVTISNTGQTVHSGISVTDDLTGVLDDATWNDDQVPSAGTLSFAAPELTWTGDLAVGASVTVTYSVKVTGAGDKRLKNVVSSETPGTDCSEGCTTDTPVAGLAIEKEVSPDKPVPGDVVTYTVTVKNTGQTAQKASFRDDLTGVLDDATWNDDAAATVGEVAYAAPALTWTGDLPIGSQAVITYSVKVTGDGDHRLTNVVTSDTPGGNCPPGSADPKCSTSTPLPGMEVSKSVDVKSAKPGDTVTYTVEVVNTGQTDLLGASFSDDLGKVLDDATFGTWSASGGTVAVAEPTLTWTGDLLVGTSVTVTYTVVVKNPVTGDFSLDNVVTTKTPGGKCVECATVTPIAGLKLVKKSEPESAKPGDTVRYTVTVTNTGKTVHSGISVTDDLSGVLDDATWIGTDAGTFTSPVLTWTGDLAVGASVTITYSVKVTGDGDKRLKNAVTSDVPETDCSDGCTTDTPVAGFQLVKKADRTEAKPGEKVTYTIVVKNTGATVLQDATFVDDMTEVLDDATYNGDAASTSGFATYAEPKLTWKGTLGQGAEATVRYSVTVTSKGDLRLKNVVTSDTPGSNCRDGCSVEVLVPRLEIVKKVDVASAKPGDLVTYTVTVTNTGQTALPAASFVDDLSGVLDDASFVDTSAGAFTAPKLTWTGELAVGATRSVTYRVRVNDPPTGDFRLRNVVTSGTPSNCPGEECGTETPVSGLEVVKKADRTEAKPGDRITYTVTVRNTGRTPVEASFSDSLADVLKHATWDGTDAGTFASPVLTWSGELAVGATATITYRVTATGPGELRNVVTSDVPGSNCKPGGSDPRCSATVKVRQDPPIAWTGFPALPLAAFGLVLVLAGVLLRRRNA